MRSRRQGICVEEKPQSSGRREHSHLSISVAHGWCQLQLQLGRNTKTGGEIKGSKLYWHGKQGLRI